MVGFGPGKDKGLGGPESVKRRQTNVGWLVGPLKPGPGKGVKRQQRNGGCGRLELEVSEVRASP